MEWAQLLSNTTDLLEVASECWMNEGRSKTSAQASQMDLLEARVRWRADLAKLSTRMSRIAEVDARIVLLELAEGLPNRDRFLSQLQTLRKRLLERG